MVRTFGSSRGEMKSLRATVLSASFSSLAGACGNLGAETGGDAMLYR